MPITATAYEIMKANERFMAALRAQDADHDWGVRTGTSYWRRLNRPEEEWQALLGTGGD